MSNIKILVVVMANSYNGVHINTIVLEQEPPIDQNNPDQSMTLKNKKL